MLIQAKSRTTLKKGGLFVENVNLQIHNYKCSEKQMKNIENKVEMFIRQIPYKSRVSIDFTYENDSFSGKLKVDFNGKSFFARDSSPLIAPLTGILCKKVQKQIMKWKKTRTVEEITGTITLPQDKKKLLSQYKYDKAS